jgi:hypothetical protein
VSDTTALHHAATCWRARHKMRGHIALLRDALAVIGTDIEEFLAEHDRRALPREVIELFDGIAEQVTTALEATARELAMASENANDDKLGEYGDTTG